MEKKVTFRDRPVSVTSSTFRQSFSELVVCGLCGWKLNTPKMLACQHTFCLSCLKTDAQKRSENGASEAIDYKCRTCKAVAPIKTFNELPNNLHIDSLLDILQAKDGDERRPLSQQLSITTESVADHTNNGIRCNKCEVLLVPSAEGPSSASDGEGKPVKPSKCKHCKLDFCPVCWTVHMEQMKTQLQGLDGQLNLVRQQLQKKSEQFETRLGDLEERVSAYIHGKMEKLKLRQAKLLGEVSRLVLPDREQLKEIKVKIRILSKSLQDEQIDQSSQMDLVFLEKHRELSRVIQSVSRWGEKQLHFDTTLGSIEMGESSSSQQVRKSSESEDPPDVEMKKRMFKVKLLWNRCPHPVGVAECPWKDDLVDDKLIYIAAADSKMVIGIERKKGRVVRKIQQSAMEYPHSIAFSADREEFAVSDKWANYVFIYNKENVLLRVIGDKGEVIGFLRSPEGVAIDGDILYVCDTGNDRVQGFDLKTGDVLFQFGNIKLDQVFGGGGGEGKSKRVELNAPTSIAIRQDLIFVLDSAECRIKVFNKLNMSQVGEFGKIGQEKGQFSDPDGIAVDEKGMIYVGDSGNARIQVFDRKLEFIRTIGSRGTGNGQFNWISGLCITETNELVVSDIKNHSVQIVQ